MADVLPGRPRTYRKRNSCLNCLYVFEKILREEPSAYFCHVDHSTRPHCGSVIMAEGFFDDAKGRKAGDLISEWAKWARKREVRPDGICGEWRKGPDRWLM